MEFKCKITVVDIFGSPVKGAVVMILNSEWGYQNSNHTGNDGTISYSVSPTGFTNVSNVRIRISHAGFQNGEILISSDGSQWNDRTSKVKINNGVIEIIYTIGKVREAPTVYLSNLSLLSTPLERIVCKSAKPYDYILNHTNPNINYKFINNYRYIKNKDICKDANGVEWSRFDYTTKNINTEDFGRFRWFEYIYDKGEIYLFAAWIPKQLKKNDYFIFFSPTTAGAPKFKLDIGSPPYGFKKDGDTLIQPFLLLGNLYMLANYFIVHQIVSSDKEKPIIIFPVNHYGKISFFSGDSNSMRSLKEINLFLHKRNYLKSDHTESASSDTYNFIKKNIDILPIRKIITGAFSEGYGRLSNLFNSTSKEFQEKWLEIWDIDGAIKSGKEGWDDFLKKLSKWYTNSTQEKKFRLIHCDVTFGAELITNFSDPKKYGFIQTALPSKTSQGTVLKKNNKKTPIQITELHDKQHKWSVIYLNDASVTSDSQHETKIIQLFDQDAHHFIPKIGIAYAANQ